MSAIEPGTDVADQQNYIFGYGSLIEDASRRSTTPAARNAWPVRVLGITRGWWARGAATGLTTTPVPPPAPEEAGEVEAEVSHHSAKKLAVWHRGG